MRYIYSLVLLLAPSVVLAQDCESVIALSKTQAVTVSDEETVNQHAENFCNEYSKSSGSSSSTSVGASYKFLSASFGQSGASMEQVASRYCAASNSFNASKDAYREYVENISPNAYAAYAQCLAMTKQSLRFNLDIASILPNEFSMAASFNSDVAAANTAKLAFSAASGVECSWEGGDEKTITISSGSTALVRCTRADATKKAYVTFVRKDGAGNAPMTLPWPAYNDEGIPIDTVEALQSNLATTISATQKLGVAIEQLQTENQALKNELLTQISRRKMTWVRSGEGCPEGSNTLGAIGVIMHNSQYGQNVGQGGRFNEGWTWTHPTLCWFP